MAETPETSYPRCCTPEKETANEITERQLRDEMTTLFFTGHETTALALSWTFYLLAQHPEAEQKLFEEVDRVLGAVHQPSRTYPSLVL